MPIAGWAGVRSLDAQRWAILSLSSLSRKVGRSSGKPAHLAVGERGELEALFFLRKGGFKVVERRWRTPELNGDLDLIAWENGVLCVIEVKTRTKRDFAPAASAVDEQKRRMLRRMGRAFRRTLPREVREEITWRFDVVSVYLIDGKTECELVREAFSANDSSRPGV